MHSTMNCIHLYMKYVILEKSLYSDPTHVTFDFGQEHKFLGGGDTCQFARIQTVEFSDHGLTIDV